MRAERKAELKKRMNLREKEALYVSGGEGYGKAPWHWWRCKVRWLVRCG